ncbi:hypothetical protein QAD02_011688 [Eretmocerus hayati]|uniref:Uncharacterized protein n=1 Tax=Eretmocerus hayati TaxID=131215 RepID=A0ACC2NXQ7_9HYME|nr:hypothetical protein QAD02_011688 [Eretmocerus hayati]
MSYHVFQKASVTEQWVGAGGCLYYGYWIDRKVLTYRLDTIIGPAKIGGPRRDVKRHFKLYPGLRSESSHILWYMDYHFSNKGETARIEDPIEESNSIHDSFSREDEQGQYDAWMDLDSQVQVVDGEPVWSLMVSGALENLPANGGSLQHLTATQLQVDKIVCGCDSTQAKTVQNLTKISAVGISIGGASKELDAIASRSMNDSDEEMSSRQLQFVGQNLMPALHAYSIRTMEHLNVNQGKLQSLRENVEQLGLVMYTIAETAAAMAIEEFRSMVQEEEHKLLDEDASQNDAQKCAQHDGNNAESRSDASDADLQELLLQSFCKFDISLIKDGGANDYSGACAKSAMQGPLHSLIQKP